MSRGKWHKGSRFSSATFLVSHPRLDDLASELFTICSDEISCDCCSAKGECQELHAMDTLSRLQFMALVVNLAEHWSRLIDMRGRHSHSKSVGSSKSNYKP